MVTRGEWGEEARLGEALQGEWPRLVRLCARLAGDAQVAEDLAQETLVEAWRHRDRVYDPDGLSPWLSAIAHNVCRRWWRRQAGVNAHAGMPTHRGPLAEDDDTWPVDDADPLRDVERDELAAVLDRALALLPADTRAVLVAAYIDDAPGAEIAARLGVSEGAVKLRLHRGRLVLRRVLHTHMPDELAAYGLAAPEDGAWQETRLWCPRCGRSHLAARFSQRDGLLVLRCAQCGKGEPEGTLVHTCWPALIGGVTGVKAALSRLTRWADPYYRAALTSRVAPCVHCGRPTRVRVADDASSRYFARAVRHDCDYCAGASFYQSLDGLILFHPAGQRFLREHKRTRILPERIVEADGRPAVVCSYDSLGGHARLAGLFALDTYELLDVRVSDDV